MPAPALPRIATRIVLASGFALALGYGLGRPYVELLLPLYKSVVGLLLPEYRIVDLTSAQLPTGAVVMLKLELMHQTLVGWKLLPPGFPVSSSTLQGHAVQHLVIIVAVLLAWPLPGHAPWWHRPLLLLSGMPLLLLVEMLDLPLVLAGSATDLLLAHFASGRLAESWLVRLMHFLDGGGRMALSFAAALVSVACFDRFRRTFRTS